jgi:hypothetical protein
MGECEEWRDEEKERERGPEEVDCGISNDEGKIIPCASD